VAVDQIELSLAVEFMSSGDVDVLGSLMDGLKLGVSASPASAET
jgi:hypothetical protein